MYAFKVNSHSQTWRMSAVETSARQTPKTDFGSIMQKSLVRVGEVAGDGLRVAAPYVPGGAIISAALAGHPSTHGSSGSVGRVLGMSQGLMATGQRNSFEQALQASQELAEFNAEFNLQYLRLQQQMSENERMFTATSNVLKKRDDTAKAMIHNIS